jgi:two-component system chemotaxis sensor kinase CheA
VASEFDAEFFDQFLDDFFAEADELLRSVRRHLLAFEDALSEGRAIPQGSVNELFRSFHTLKGISAMANVSAAETLAHHMESYLRQLRDGHSALSRDGLVSLIESTKKLEQVVAARREGGEVPQIDADLRRLESLGNALDAGIAEEERAPAAAEAVSGPDGGAVYKFVFEPSAELAERGVNVNAIRARIESNGTVRDSKPVIKEGGKIAFEFVAAWSGDPDTESWLADGVTIEPFAHEGGVAKTDEPEQPNEDVMPESVRTGLFGQSNVVRVDLARLDDLMLMVGELVISRGKLAEQLRQIERYVPAERERHLHEIDHTIEKQLRNLRDGVMRVRMVPIGEVFERMQFVARDLARETGKRIKLEITGENTEIDKLLVERMLDPLLHLVRNAISHGIEPAAVREAAGKLAEGTVRLHAAAVGDSVEIEISDDGRGIDRGEVAAKARQKGLLSESGELDDEALLAVLCAPGFSTRDEADRTSGRGVGMDVVRRTTDELGGSITLETENSKGTKFTICLPLTLAIADALIVTVDGERFAVPQTSVREVIEVEQSAVTRFENNEVIEYRGEAMPLVRLAKVFDLEGRKEGAFHAFVTEQAKQPVGIAVDRVVGQREIVIRSITDPLAQVPGVSGATELGDGRAVLILDVAEIAKRMKREI